MEAAQEVSSSRRTFVVALLQGLAGIGLFSSTAAVVWWQNSRVTVLYDLCGVLEPATRIAQGDVPYRDFPFPYAPLTFLTQAELIRLTGAVYWHHIAYASVVAGLAAVLGWRIINDLLAGWMHRARLTAFVLSLPITVLGIYCIFPHPFYDPDACFVILLAVWLLLYCEKREWPVVRTFVTGVVLAVPLFIKQNIGLALLASIGVWLAIAFVAGWRRKVAVGQYVALCFGIVSGLAVALTIIHFTCGLDNYELWTFTFATARRTPSILDMLTIYADWSLPIFAASLLIGGSFLLGEQEIGWPRKAIGTALVVAPFLWPVVYLLIDGDASERAERLMNVWPVVFVVLLILAYGLVRSLTGVAAALPFILIATSHGVFLSQQLWGSTYGIWPLLMIMIALMLRLMCNAEKESEVPHIVTVCVMSACLLVAGSFYVYSNERLDYVDKDDGEIAHSKLPQLAGLSIRGDYLPDFEELVEYTDQNIPREDGILYLPGEDLFYYTTGRRPHFPVLLFDVTNNPYNADEIRQRVLASNIEWIIVKEDTQLETDNTIDSKGAIFEQLKPAFRQVESLNNYDIYKRRHFADPPADDDDDNNDAGDDDTGN
ncbi:MAG: hypothetical protein JO053_15525 [Acidobacteria bacterium]|nr:hypothetical protein [Acidobacteriota bacterium]